MEQANMVKTSGIERRLQRIAKQKEKQIATRQELIESLLPKIDEWYSDGYTLKQICLAINDENPDLSMTYDTFKTYVSRARRQKEE